MTKLTGMHLIAGKWLGGEATFQADNPAGNNKNQTAFYHGTVDLVDFAATAAKECFESFATSSIKVRANFLREIAKEIDVRGRSITEIGQTETALPAARLEGERGRTVGQLRFFADWIEEGHWLGARIDQALPDRTPLPRPDIRVANKALGPVAVFGASNFPLAFSAGGGDTASALAAGCPVIVKAHSAHPGTSELVAQAIDAAIKTCGMPSGVFSMVQGGDRSVGQSLVAHPFVKAVGFTGSLGGGRALYDIATSRPEPIPFYGELGSNNPVFLLPNVMAEKASDIAEGWAGSLTMGVGQFCTNPGVIVALSSDSLEEFKQKAVSLLKETPASAMLTDRIAKAYHQVTVSHRNDNRLDCLLAPQPQDNPFCATPGVFSTNFKAWSENKDLAEEIFGPAAIIIECETEAEMVEVADNFLGQLTTTIHMNNDDVKIASALMPHLEKNSGRVLVNGFPTGVEVCHSMVHGGPYPASTDARSTSVGSLAIERFIRPISYQNLPDSLLPQALQNANPLGIKRLVDGDLTNSTV
ncbi:MAG: aldehyde dehydrogenase (NADP(+)) [Halopseudomonas aestusnigri]